MINKNMIISFDLIQSMQDDIWYQTALKSKTLKTFKVKDGEVVVSPTSMSESVFWLSDTSGTWRVIVKAVYADEFHKIVVNMGVVETLNMLR